MHSAEFIYKVIETNPGIRGEDVVKKASIYARQTVQWKLSLLQSLEAVVATGGKTTYDSAWHVYGPLDMAKVRKLIAERNARARATKSIQTEVTQPKKLTDDSRERTEQRREAGLNGKLQPTGRRKKVSMEPDTVGKVEKFVAEKLHSTQRVRPSMEPVPTSAVDAAVDAVENVPLRDLAELRSRLKPLLGDLHA